MRIPCKKLIGVSVICFIVGMYLMSEISVSKDVVEEIWLDTSRPVTIEFPFEVVEIGENGETGLSIGAQAGRGWLGEAGGSATYNFHAPCSGQYVLWAYCIWRDECTNAFYAQVDESDKAIIGNDPVFDRWHWVRGFTVNLEKGFHVLRLSNHSDNVAVRKVFLTNSTERTPNEEDAVAISLFRDNFNGCDKGNFRLWDNYCGSWEVKDREHQTSADNLLVGKSTSQALLALKQWEWSDFVLTVSVRSLATSQSDGWVGLCFGLRSEQEYYQLRWREVPSTNTAKMELVKRNRSRTEVLATYEVSWHCGRWHELELDIASNQIQINIDGGIRHLAQLSEKVEGGIGFWLSGDIETHFDDVYVWKHRKETR